jgi:arabinofuranosyltransferase
MPPNRNTATKPEETADPGAVGFGVRVALIAALGLLVAHAWSYRFLTDDAFISFRYARNLSLGHGLVFNPGGERVEGYTNFLWVILIAFARRLGVAPELSSVAMSLMATALLGALVGLVSLGRRVAGVPAWLVVVAPLLLAVTRSVAVWSTSGLETRLFELLVIAGLLLLIRERERFVRADATGARSAGPLAPWLLGLACLTRPEGFFFALGGALAVALWAASRRAFDVRRFMLTWLPCILLVLALVAFRRLYYGEWVPNTYYAKVGGRSWWSAGGLYLLAFGIEYAAWLWLPLVVLGAIALHRASDRFTTWLLACAILPFLLSVAAIGGDHFEYRPLDLLFPLAFLLVAEGLRGLARRGWPPVALVAWLALTLIGLWELPAQSRRQFPDAEVVGYPGVALGEREDAYSYLDPSRSAVYRWPPLRSLALVHRDALRTLTAHFIGIREEEHRTFARSALRDGARVRGLLDRGVLPRDVHLAMGAVGAIPYVSDARTLDVLGLTDARVAHGPFRPAAMTRMMAHAKEASPEYLGEAGVDLAAVDAHITVPATSEVLLVSARDLMLGRDSTWAAEIGQGWYLVASLPGGIARARARLPQLDLHLVSEPAFIARWLDEAVAMLADSIARHPDDTEARRAYAFRLLLSGQVEPAMAEYLKLTNAVSGSAAIWADRALAEQTLGEPRAARASLARAESLAIARADTLHQRIARERLEAVEASEAGTPR